MSKTPPVTRAQRLDALVRKVAPKAAAYYAEHGRWPDAEGSPRRGSSPYVIETTKTDGRRIRIATDDGDVISGIGGTIEEALAALEVKVR
jgi:hypothetical protein